MNYYIYAKEEEKKTRLKFKPKIKRIIYEFLTGTDLAIYIIGIALGVNFKTWIDISMIFILIAFSVFVALEDNENK